MTRLKRSLELYKVTDVNDFKCFEVNLIVKLNLVNSEVYVVTTVNFRGLIIVMFVECYNNF